MSETVESYREFTVDIRDDQEMGVITEQTTLFYANKDHALRLSILCTAVTVLFHCIARMQGRVRTNVHGGLHLFWSSLVLGELAGSVTCLAVVTYTYLVDNGQPSTLTCADFSPLSKSFAYGWLLLWIVFVVAVLRGTVAITWLNRIRDAERLADMARGIGILCLSLIYLFPLALLSRHDADSIPRGYQPFTVCIPAFDHGLDIVTVQISVCVCWSAAIIVAFLVSARCSRTLRMSRLAIPLVLITHFVPTMLFFIWLTNVLELERFRDSVPAVYSLVIALSATCNFFTYKLFPLATKDAEESAHGSQCHRCESGDLDTKSVNYFSEPPPMYVEKGQGF